MADSTPKQTTLWQRYRAKIFLTYLIVAVVIFIILAVLAKSIAYFTFDVTITRAIQTFNPAWFDALMRALTWMGFAPQAWIITLAILALLFARGLKWETLVASASVVGSSALGLGLKVLIDRPRPSADLVNVMSQLKDYSFPSGHVLFFTTFFGFLFFLAYTLLKPGWRRTGLIGLLVGLILLIGPARIYMGQHWASDVIAAYLIGSGWLMLSIVIYRWGKLRFGVTPPLAKETD